MMFKCIVLRRLAFDLGFIMDPIEMMHDRLLKLEEKIDTTIKDLHIKIDQGFNKTGEQFNELFKFKWKIIGATGVIVFTLTKVIPLAVSIIERSN